MEQIQNYLCKSLSLLECKFLIENNSEPIEFDIDDIMDQLSLVFQFDPLHLPQLDNASETMHFTQHLSFVYDSA